MSSRKVKKKKLKKKEISKLRSFAHEVKTRNSDSLTSEFHSRCKNMRKVWYEKLTWYFWYLFLLLVLITLFFFFFQPSKPDALLYFQAARSYIKRSHFWSIRISTVDLSRYRIWFGLNSNQFLKNVWKIARKSCLLPKHRS